MEGRLIVEKGCQAVYNQYLLPLQVFHIIFKIQGQTCYLTFLHVVHLLILVLWDGPLKTYTQACHN